MAPDGKCLDVAIDHAFFNEPAFLDGIEDIRKAVRTVVAAGPDAIQLSPGTAFALQLLSDRPKPALALRTDITNAYAKGAVAKMFDQLIEDPVEQAVRLDAACVVANLLFPPDQLGVYEQCLENIARLKPLCDRAAMPLMVEPLVLQSDSVAGGYKPDLDVDKIRSLVRQAVELGADVIKADPSEDVTDYHKVIEAASGIPVLVRGGGRAPDEAVLQRTYDLMAQGAHGIVYGRNIIHHLHPDRMTQALMAIVHDAATPARALTLLSP